MGLVRIGPDFFILNLTWELFQTHSTGLGQIMGVRSLAIFHKVFLFASGVLMLSSYYFVTKGVIPVIFSLFDFIGVMVYTALYW